MRGSLRHVLDATLKEQSICSSAILGRNVHVDATLTSREVNETADCMEVLKLRVLRLLKMEHLSGEPDHPEQLTQ